MYFEDVYLKLWENGFCHPEYFDHILLLFFQFQLFGLQFCLDFFFGFSGGHCLDGLVTQTNFLDFLLQLSYLVLEFIFPESEQLWGDYYLQKGLGVSGLIAQKIVQFIKRVDFWVLTEST